jgi:hypothetical protein
MQNAFVPELTAARSFRKMIGHARHYLGHSKDYHPCAVVAPNILSMFVQVRKVLNVRLAVIEISFPTILSDK